MKRLLSLLLTLALLVTTLPIAAFATEGEDQQPEGVVLQSEAPATEAPTPTPTPDPTPEATPTSTPEATPVSTPGATPSSTPAPDNIPPSGDPATVTPSVEPTDATPTPSDAAPSVAPTETPLAKVLMALAVPPAPTQFSVSSNGKTSVYISWKAVATNAGYKIQYSTSSTFASAVKTLTINGGSVNNYTLSGLVCGTTYYVRACAFNSDNVVTQDGPWTSAASIKPCALAPVSFKATPYTVSSVMLTWTASKEATGYIISRDGIDIAVISKNTTIAYVDNSVNIGSTYTYKIYSYCTSTSIRSQDYGEVVYAAAPPTPTSLKAVSAGLKSIKLTWKAVSDVDGYYLYRSANGGASYSLCATITGASTNTYTDKDLTTGKEYKYYLVAYEFGTNSANSAVVSCTPVPSAPVTVKVASRSDTSLKIAWTEVADVAGYKVFASNKRDSNFMQVADTQALSFIETGLATGVARYYRVYAYDVTGDVILGDPSALVCGVPAPITPTDLQATNTTINSITLTWSASNGATGYEIWRSSTSATEGFTRLTDTAGCTYLNKSLNCGTTYYYKIRPYVLLAGDTTKYLSAVSAVVTLQARPPASGKAAAAAASATSIKVAWYPVAGVHGYLVYQILPDGTKTKVATVAGAASKACYIYNLAPGGMYRYYVYPYYNNPSTIIGAPAATSWVTLDLSAPTGLNASSVNNMKDIQLTWKAVPGATSYIVRATSIEDSDPNYTFEKTVTSASCILPSVTLGAKYTVTVQAASKASGSMMYSAESAEYGAYLRPAVPASLKASCISSGIRIVWEEVPNVDGYVIYRRDPITKVWTELETVNDVLVYTDTDVKSDPSHYGKTYTYGVRSYYYELGRKITSPTYVGAAATLTLPAPTLKAASLSATSGRLAWTQVPDADGYQVLCSSTANGSYTMLKNVSTLYYNSTSMKIGTPMYFKVRPYILVNGSYVMGALSAAAVITPAIVAPVTVAARAYTKSAKVAWTVVAGASGYNIYRATSASGTYSKIATVSGGTTKSYIATGLACGQTYYFRVSAYSTVNNTNYEGVKSTVVSATTSAQTPTGLTATVASVNSLKLTWTGVSDVDGYRISMATSASGPFTVLGTVSGSTKTYTAKNLPMAEDRFFRIESYSGSAYSPASAAIVAQVVPLKPTELKLIGRNSSALAIQWKPVPGASGYTLYYQKKGSTALVKYVSVTGNGISQYKISGLDSVSQYTIYVRSFYSKADGTIVYGGKAAVVGITK